MTILRMSIFVLSVAYSVSAFSQADQQMNYQCSSGTSLNDGFLTYKTGQILAVAKHKDGTISEISGMLGNLQQIASQPSSTIVLQPQNFAQMGQISASVNQFVTNPGQPFQGGMMGMQMDLRTGMSMGMVPGKDFTGSGAKITDMGNGTFVIHFDSNTADQAPDRSDIQSARTRYVEQTAGDAAGKISRPGAYIQLGQRPGDIAGTKPKPGDPDGSGSAVRAPASVEQSTQPRKPIHLKAGDLVMTDKITAYSARLDSQGNISEISFRIGKQSGDKWRANSKNSANAQSVYTTLNGELANVKSRAYCCTKNPGANCGTNLDQTGAQYSLRTEKPSVGERVQNAWADLINAFKPASSNAAK